jgi:hypothetical protein
MLSQNQVLSEKFQQFLGFFHKNEDIISQQSREIEDFR